MSDIESLLYHACQNGYKLLALSLISRLVVIPEHNRLVRHDKWDSTPLHEACRRGWLDVVQRLVQKVNHDIDVTTKRSSQSPLHISCQNGGVDIVRFLTKHGCNPVLRDKSGKEPLDYALENNHTDIVHYICTHCITSAMMLAPDRTITTLNILNKVLHDESRHLDWKMSNGDGIVEIVCYSKLITQHLSPKKVLKLVNHVQARIDNKSSDIIPHLICRDPSRVSCIPSVVMMEWLKDIRLDPMKLVISCNWRTSDSDSLVQLVCKSESYVSCISSKVMLKWLTDTTIGLIKVVVVPNYKTANGDTLLQLVCQSKLCVSCLSSTDILKWLTHMNTDHDLMELKIVPNYKTADGDTLLTLICQTESCVSRISSTMLKSWLKETNVDLFISGINWKTADGNTVISVVHELSEYGLSLMHIHPSIIPTDIIIIPHWESIDCKVLFLMFYRSELCIYQTSSKELLKWLQKTNLDLEKIVSPNWKTADGDTLLQLVCQSDMCVSRVSSAVMLKWLNKTKVSLKFIIPNYETACGDTLLQLICQSESCLSCIPAETLKTWLKSTTIDLYIDNLDWKTLDNVTMIEVICRLESQPLRKLSVSTPIAVVIIPSWENVDGSTSLQILHFYDSDSYISHASSTDTFKWLQKTNLNLERIISAVPNWKTADGDTLLQLVCLSKSYVSRTSSTILLKLLTHSSLDLELILPNFKTADGKTLFQLVCQSKSCVIRISSTVMLKWLTDTTHDLMELVVLNHKTADGDTLLQLICRSESCVSRVSSKMLEYSLKSTNAELLVPNLYWKTADGVRMNKIVQEVINSKQFIFGSVKYLSKTQTDVVITPHWETDDGSIILQVLYQSEMYISQLSSASLSKWLQRTNIDVGKIVFPHWKTADGDTLLQLVCQSESSVSRISSTVSPSDGLLDLVFHSEYLISQITSQVILTWLNSTKFILDGTIVSSWKTKNRDSISKVLCTSHVCFSHISSSLMLQWLNDVDTATFNTLKSVHPDWTTNDGDTILHLLCKSSMKENKVVELLQYYLQLSILNPNLTDCDGNTAIHLACKDDKADVVTFLLTNIEWNLNVRNHSGLSALEMTKNPEIILCICQYDNIEISSNVVKGWLNDTTSIDDQSMMKIVKLLHHKHKLKTCTLLHLSCGSVKNLCRDTVSLVQCLICEYNCDPNCLDDNGQMPLQLTSDPKIMKELVRYGARIAKDILFKIITNTTEDNVSEILLLSITKKTMMWKPTDVNDDGDTALHLACKVDKPDLVTCLLANMECSLNVRNHSGLSALEMTKNPEIILCICQYDNIEISSNVVKGWLNDTTSIDDQSMMKIVKLLHHKHKLKTCTLLHLSCGSVKNLCRDTVSLVQCLICEHNCDPNCLDDNGQTPLQLTSDPKIMKELVKFGARITKDIMFKITMNIAEDSASEILLLSTTKKTMLWKPTDINDDGDTALRLACKVDKPAIVTYLLKQGNCNPSDNNLKNELPIELTTNIDTISLLMEHGAILTPKLIVKFAKLKSIPNDRLAQLIWNPNITNSDGNTALHLACQANKPETVNFLLSQALCDPNVKNNSKEVPLQMTTNADIIKDLIRYGAQTSMMYESHKSALGTNEPIKPPVKMFVVGNHSVGKSTLTAALKKKLNFVVRLFTSGKVSGVEKKTIGIIPHEFESDIFGRVTVYDFAGHREFYSGHAALLKAAIQSTPPVFLLVVNLLDEENEIFQNILYWISFLENQCTLVSCKPHLIIVGSHADTLKSKGVSPQEKVNTLVSLLDTSYFINLELIGFIPMDCQRHESTGMNDLRPLLVRSCSQLRIQEPITFNAHCFLVYLLETFKETPAVTISTIHEQIKKELLSHNNGVLDFLPKSAGAVYKICVELNERGHILFLRDRKNLETDSYVVIEEKILLSEVSGTVFAPEDFKQYKQLATTTGVVSLSKLAVYFPGKDLNILIGVLTHLEFCHEISDQALVQLISEKYSRVSDERYYLFPGLISIKAKESIWDTNTDFDYSFGWMLRCTKPEQFFSSRFLQVLLLRLAFSLPFDLKDLNDDPDSLAIHRKCSLWKNGIFWGTHFGMDILVEIVDNKSVVVMARFKASHLVKCIEQRSQVLHTVLECVEEFCPRMSRAESFIETSCSALKYPIQLNSWTCTCTISDFAEALVINCENPSVVLSESGKSVSAQSFVSFEPYAEIEASILQELWDNKNDNKAVPNAFVSRLIEKLSHDKIKLLIRVFNESAYVPVDSTCIKDNLYQEIVNWRDKSETELRTLKDLREKLNSHSVFAGRNILVSTHHYTNPTFVCE